MYKGRVGREPVIIVDINVRDLKLCSQGRTQCAYP